MANCFRFLYGGECPGSQPTECCVRICWSDPCVTDWDLWVRERTEGGSMDKWCSYLDPGPVGESGMEYSGDISKAGDKFSTDILCSPSNPQIAPCDMPAGDKAGEVICWCLDPSMTFPKTYDVVINFFGADCTCHGGTGEYVGSLCVTYLCADDYPGSEGGTEGMCIEKYETMVTGPLCGSGIEQAGNFGAGEYPMPVLEVSEAKCTCMTGGTSVCWVITARRKDGSLFIDRGPGRAPDKYIVPDDVDPKTCVMAEDGVTIPRRQYQVVNESVAKALRLKTTDEFRGLKLYKGKCPDCKKKGRKFRLL